MYKIIFFWVISVFQFLNAQEVNFQVLDEVSGLPIEYVSINLLNGKGFYGDKNGIVIYDFENIDSLEISHVSYISRTINTSEIADRLYLKPKDFALDEVILLSDKKKKQSEKEFEAPKINSFYDFGVYGGQIITKIASPKPLDVFLEEITIPLVYDEIWMQVNGIKKLPNVIIRVDFHQVNDSLIQNPILESEYFVITNKQIKNGKVDLKLKNNPIISSEGILFAVTFIGKADENGNLIFENPNYISSIKGKNTIMTKYIPIQISLVLETGPLKSFVGNVFSENPNFFKIAPRISVAGHLNPAERRTAYLEKLDQMLNFTFNFKYKYYFYE